MEPIEPDLIYDVGLLDGQDSAYYLAKGYRVVAIEANPEFAQQGKQRFRAEITEGRLTVLNVAVAETTGKAMFWICDDSADWSSLDREIASRQGTRLHATEVATRSFREILSENGLPYYCKVDIEGSEHLCVEALSREYRPTFFSAELYIGIDSLLDRLADLGYDRFKVIDQIRFATATEAFYRAQAALSSARLKRGLERMNSVLDSRSRDGEWEFRSGSSGALPERTRGGWLSYRRARQLIALLKSQQRQRGIDRSIDPEYWFDLHATDRASLSRR